jgi:hypothetical protein
MDRFLKFIPIILLTVFMITACANRAAIAMGKFLHSDEINVNNEMIEATIQSAKHCGFSKVISENRISGSSIIYVDATTEHGNLVIALSKDTNKGNVSIIEGDNDRGINEGFREADSVQFACFEHELNKYLPNTFK